MLSREVRKVIYLEFFCGKPLTFSFHLKWFVSDRKLKQNQFYLQILSVFSVITHWFLAISKLQL